MLLGTGKIRGVRKLDNSSLCKSKCWLGLWHVTVISYSSVTDID